MEFDSPREFNFNRFTVETEGCDINRTTLYKLTDFDQLQFQTRPANPNDRTDGPKKCILISNSKGEEVVLDLGIETYDVPDERLTEGEKSRGGLTIPMMLIKNTYAHGFTSPSAIQAPVIPELLIGKDAVIQFKSGTGKTYTYLLGTLYGFDPANPNLQHVVVTNTHENAEQVLQRLRELLPIAKSELCIGNGSAGKASFGDDRRYEFEQNKRRLRSAQILVCTVGKLYESLCTKKIINFSNLKTICVDEYDSIIVSNSRKPIGISTEEQIEMIMKPVPKTCQRLFVSATASEYAEQKAYSYLRDFNLKIGEPLVMRLIRTDMTLKGINQYYVNCGTYLGKLETLTELLHQCRITQCIVFTNTIPAAEDVRDYLQSVSNPPVDTTIFHGKLQKRERNKIYEDFCDNKIRILVSSDIFSRGVDFTGINLIINFDMPNDFDSYVHRIGRSGRFGKKGTAISLLFNDPNPHSLTPQEFVDRINAKSENSQMTFLPSDLGNIL